MFKNQGFQETEMNSGIGLKNKIPIINLP